MEKLQIEKVAEKDNSLKKVVQVVHAKPSEPLSLLQGKLCNCLIKNALDSNIDEEGWWSMPLKILSDQTGFDSNNRVYLTNSALNLMKIIFEYNDISNSNKSQLWERSVLFPEIEISRSHIRYQISKKVCEKVLNPGVYEYALIDLNSIKKFRNSASIPIYEQCVRFKSIGKTSVIDLDEFKQIVLGSNALDGIYKEYKYFKLKILNKSVTEINQWSDINIDEVIETKINRCVKTLQFIVSNKNDLAQVDKVEVIKSIYEDDIKKIGLPDSKIKTILSQHCSSDVENAIKYTLARMGDNKTAAIKNPSAYFMKVLKEKYVFVENDVVNFKPTVESVQPSKIDDDLQIEIKRKKNEDYQKAFFLETMIDQNLIISKYNDYQKIKNLKIIKDKKNISEQAMRMFYNWYGEKIHLNR